MVSPVNWVYSVRNALDDWGAPRRLVDQFSLSSPLSLGVFTLVDGGTSCSAAARVLRAVLRKPG